MEFILIIILSYCIGSFPNGLVLGKLIWGIDLRDHGSNNIGATNAYRTLGKGPAALIFAGDLLKGVAGVWIGSALSGTPAAMIAGGIMAIVGHNWSVVLKFTGGKGVATGLGVIAMLMPQVTIVVFLAWCAIVYVTKYVSLGSIVAAALVPICSFLLGNAVEYSFFGVFAAVFVIYRHKTNIGRLINGTEVKIKAGHMNRQ